MEKKIVLPIMVIFALVVISGLAFANEGSFYLPSAGTNHTGTVSIAMNYTNGTDIGGGVVSDNCTCYHNASGTWTAFTDTITVQEASTVASNITMTGTLTSSLDSKGVSINCTIGNETAIIDGFTPVVVTFDTTKPVMNLEFDRQSISPGDLFRYTISISDATSGINVKNCNITDPEGTITSATTDANDLLFQTGRLIDSGTWTLNCKASDYAGNTNSASTTLSSNTIGSKEEGIAEKIKANKNKLILLILAVGCLYLLSQRK